MFNLPPEMLKTYLQRKLDEVPLLQKDLETNSIASFNRCGHQMMGNAKSFGFINLEPIAIKMDQLSLIHLQEVGPQLIEEFTNCVMDNLKALN